MRIFQNYWFPRNLKFANIFFKTLPVKLIILNFISFIDLEKQPIISVDIDDLEHAELISGAWLMRGSISRVCCTVNAERCSLLYIQASFDMVTSTSQRGRSVTEDSFFTWSHLSAFKNVFKMVLVSIHWILLRSYTFSILIISVRWNMRIGLHMFERAWPSYFIKSIHACCLTKHIYICSFKVWLYLFRNLNPFKSNLKRLYLNINIYTHTHTHPWHYTVLSYWPSLRLSSYNYGCHIQIQNLNL